MKLNGRFTGWGRPIPAAQLVTQDYLKPPPSNFVSTAGRGVSTKYLS